MKKRSRQLIMMTCMTAFILSLPFNCFAATKEKCPIQNIKLKKIRKRERMEESRHSYSDILYTLKYRVSSWNAKKANLNIYVYRKKRDKVTTYKMTRFLEGKDIEKGNGEKIVARDYEEESGTYTRAKHGKIRKIRVEVWYPAYGGTLVDAIEIPRQRSSSMPSSSTDKKDKKHLTWWEKIEYGDYY